VSVAGIEIVLDCHDPESLAPFWAAALGYRIQGYREPYLALVPESGDAPRLVLQRVPEPRPGKNRMHIDIKTPSMEAEAERLEKLGASRLVNAPESGGDWIVMCDPEGNEFCVCQE
jgi:predicted enzyme related to lactoylglutathione lyase